MDKFIEIGCLYFEFLKDYGYSLSTENNNNTLKYNGENNSVIIVFSPVQCELMCYVSGLDNELLTLQEILDHFDLTGYYGMYQISDKEDVEKGIKYLSEIVRQIWNEKRVMDANVFRRIYRSVTKRQSERLSHYYVSNELKEAEECWRRGDYQRVQSIYEKNFKYLSELQEKKLDYIKRQKDRLVD